MKMCAKFRSSISSRCDDIVAEVKGGHFMPPSGWRVARRPSGCRVNPRPGGGGVRPPLSFLRCTPNYEADRAEMLYCLWRILCATFDKHKSPRHVRSRSYDVTGTRSDHFLLEMGNYCTFEGDINYNEFSLAL